MLLVAPLVQVPWSPTMGRFGRGKCLFDWNLGVEAGGVTGGVTGRACGKVVGEQV